MTIEDIKAIVRGGETRALEVKKTTGELKDGFRSVCAFLNTSGGWLFFGIVPTTLKILGQEVTDNTRKEIAREIAKLEPQIDQFVEYIDVPNRQGCQVIAIHSDPPSYWGVPLWPAFVEMIRRNLLTTNGHMATFSRCSMLAWFFSSNTSPLVARLLALQEKRNSKSRRRHYVRP